MEAFVTPAEAYVFEIRFLRQRQEDLARYRADASWLPCVVRAAERHVCDSLDRVWHAQQELRRWVMQGIAIELNNHPMFKEGKIVASVVEK